jgi:predicted alpha/beta superfamily hydrolase
LVSCKQTKEDANDNHKTKSEIQIKKLETVVLSSGTLNRVELFPSDYVKPRHVDIWLPDHYSNDKKFNVLYMHDGQMLFDSTTTWNKQEWKVDEWASKLMKEEITKDFIVVAMHNISDIRHSDYFPNKPFQQLKVKDSIMEASKRGDNPLFKEDINSDNYLKFIVKEVKPFIDSNFSVHTDRDHTFVAGSSMGGLISMYAINEYPDVFSGAACISTHWPGVMSLKNNPIPQTFFSYIKENTPQPGTHRFYFDFGTETLDAYYVEFEDDVNDLFKELGYDESNFRNLKFEGTDHSENSWNQRLDIPLTFLLSKTN